MAGRPGSDRGDLGAGERHCLGEMAPLVRIFLRRPPAEAGRGISSKEPRWEPSLELKNYGHEGIHIKVLKEKIIFLLD